VVSVFSGFSWVFNLRLGEIFFPPIAHALPIWRRDQAVNLQERSMMVVKYVTGDEMKSKILKFFRA
jgi:hypothetical protein